MVIETEDEKGVTEKDDGARKARKVPKESSHGLMLNIETEDEKGVTEKDDGARKARKVPKESSYEPMINLGSPKTQRNLVLVFIVVIIVVILLALSIISVPAGHKAVAVAGFGVGNQFDEGWQLKNPLTTVENVRYNTQILTEVISARSTDGYNVDIDFAIRYHLREHQVGTVRVENPDYQDTVVISILRSQARKTVSDWNMTGEEMNLQRSSYEAEVDRRVTDALAFYHVVVEEVMIRNLDFPLTVNTAWENRAAAEIDVDTAAFELEAERQRALKEVMRALAEKNSTVILAEGQAEALRILANESVNMDNATMQYILSLRYISMLKDPDSNVGFVILSDSDNPFILDLERIMNPDP